MEILAGQGLFLLYDLLIYPRGCQMPLKENARFETYFRLAGK